MHRKTSDPQSRTPALREIFASDGDSGSARFVILHRDLEPPLLGLGEKPPIGDDETVILICWMEDRLGSTSVLDHDRLIGLRGDLNDLIPELG